MEKTDITSSNKMQDFKNKLSLCETELNKNNNDTIISNNDPLF